ncbi:MAG: error-prone DNA polymerase, partial [Phycisphaerales bacterium]|nr:error-prone DNA polymerase [Phycisphaerales bacterium]
MPEVRERKAHDHPLRQRPSDTPSPPRAIGDYAELAVTSNFTFLTGGSHPDEFVRHAAALGYAAIGVTDRNTLAGVVRAHVTAKEVGMPFRVGCRLRLLNADGVDVLVYPTSRAAYGGLCRLLTIGKRRATKGECDITLDDLAQYQDGLLAIAVPPNSTTRADITAPLRRLRDMFDDDRLSLALTRRYDPHDDRDERLTREYAKQWNIPLVVVNDAHYHTPRRRPLQDVLTCIRHRCTLAEAGYRLLVNSERHLKSPDEMRRLFAHAPNALRRTRDIADRAAGFSLDQLRYEYPDELCPSGATPMRRLTELTWRGAALRYPKGVPESVRKQIEHELRLVDELQYAPYFLTVQDLVRFARGRGILCQGRGAAANSAVCFCLGVTSVDPDRINILFERFVSRERAEPPDIDIDFEHERREEVIQYLYRRYGRERAGLTATVISYRRRSAIREVGKALGLSLDAIDRLAKRSRGWADRVFEGDAGEALSNLDELGFDARNPTMRRLVALASEISGFPRHLSQHVGGFVITRGRLDMLVPIENAAMPDRTTIEWDKDDIEALGILKVDVLGLGMLTCLRKSFELIERHHQHPLTLATIPAEDPEVYDMVSRADTVGVFQIESRAQMTMLPRLKPRCFYDLVIEVAIVRPGPIVGNMVHPYLRRRNGEETVTYPTKAVEEVLKRTLGVPLFQEQAMALAIVAAGFTPGEAEALRRVITAWKSKEAIARYRKRFIDGMLANGYEQAFVDQCFERLKGFSEYGFPESHAASFALLVYA